MRPDWCDQWYVFFYYCWISDAPLDGHAGLGAISGMSFYITAGSEMHRGQRGSQYVSMRPDGHAGLGPEGHCDMYAHLGSNVCRRRNDLLAFVQQPKSS